MRDPDRCAFAIEALAGRLAAPVLLLLAPTAASAQHFLEARVADPTYYYLDWNYTFPRPAIVDLFYVGVTGSNEFNLGGGYGFAPSASWHIAPLAYAVFAEEGDQRGVKLAVLASFARQRWKVGAFLAHFARVSGDVASYEVLDTLDATRMLGTHLELGISGGFFHAGGEWNPHFGPLVRWNDRSGYWAVSYLFGEQGELRAGRVFVPKSAAPRAPPPDKF